MTVNKQTEKAEVTIGEYIFNIFPFSAMLSARLSAEIMSTIGPVLSNGLPIIGAIFDGDKGLLQREFAEIAPALASAFSALSPEKFEALIRNLIIDNNNISFCTTTDSTVSWLSIESFDEIFCKNIMGIYQLAFEVVKLNYADFFTKLKDLFGSQIGTMEKEQTQKITVI